MVAVKEDMDKMVFEQRTYAAIQIQKTWRGYRARDMLWVRGCILLRVACVFITMCLRCLPACQVLLRYIRQLTKRLETCVTDDGVVYYYDPDTGTSTYTQPTLLSKWNLLRTIGVVTGNGTVTGAGIELAGRSRRPYGYLNEAEILEHDSLAGEFNMSVPDEPVNPLDWELVHGNPPYYYCRTTGESTYNK